MLANCWTTLSLVASDAAWLAAAANKLIQNHDYEGAYEQLNQLNDHNAQTEVLLKPYFFSNCALWKTCLKSGLTGRFSLIRLIASPISGATDTCFPRWLW